MLSAQIADDGQWRFPEVDSVPEHFAAAICYFEDEYFFYHPGINPVSMFRALRQNVSAGHVVSGGSTLTMQLVRLSSSSIGGRNYGEKLFEAMQAVKVELHYSKEEILRLYVSHAPYGGNVVGAEAAAWRYFARPLHQLSWAEYALLAVLPNAPSLMHPGKNRASLLAKRNRLLRKLYDNRQMDSISYSLALMEEIPAKPRPLPDIASHLLDYANKTGKQGQRLTSTIDYALQSAVSARLDSYVALLSQNDIRNACAIVVSLKDGNVRAYIGNTAYPKSGARCVDLIQSPRSSGSILKPFLYAEATDVGIIHTSTLLRDVPVNINKFSPTNFDKKYSGVVPAGEALSLSLNIPAALLLRDYGIAPFYADLHNLGFSTITRPADDYGLTLVLGGAEVTLWDLARAYSYQAMAINRFRRDSTAQQGLRLWTGEGSFAVPAKPISEGAWWLISEALTNVQRPDLDQSWKLFSSSRRIAWKTGTSHGFRDAWAVGYDSGYLVAVWVGNAEGDGRPGLTGVSVAAPLMFQIFQMLPRKTWFAKPVVALRLVNLCAKSGMAPCPSCPVAQAEMPMDAKLPATCTMHRPVLLNAQGQRVTMDCAQGPVRDTVWFSLDPVAAHYYQSQHLDYWPVPSFAPSCNKTDEDQLGILYPQHCSEIIVPRDFDGHEEKVLLEATHIHPSAKLFWHLDGRYIGSTSNSHQILAHLTPGAHKLLVIDEAGNTAKSDFNVNK